MNQLHFWIFYGLGQLIHLWIKAHGEVKDPNNKLTSYRQYFQEKGPALAGSVFLCTVGFLFWLEKPDAINALLGKIGVQLPDLPLTKATAGVYGYFSDSITSIVFSKIPGLKGDA